MLASVETLYGRQAPAPMFTLNPLHLVRLNQAFPARKKGQTIQNYSIFFVILACPTKMVLCPLITAELGNLPDCLCYSLVQVYV